MEKIYLKSISFDRIAEHSAWPARLLSIDPFEARYKSSAEVDREFGVEKWGYLYNKFKDQHIVSLEDIESAEQDLNNEILCYENSMGFYLTQVKQAQIRQMKIYESVLSRYAHSSNGLVELGAGFGSKIIRLSDLKVMKDKPLVAAEYTQAGCDLISLLSQQLGKNIQVGLCDFNKLSISDIDVPTNSIIFTSYSVHYVPELKKEFVDFLNNFNPRVVVHFEPCYEYFNTNSLHGLMCKRYMELNGYTKNIASTIVNGCDQIKASTQIQKNVFGSNPFLPFSVIEWSTKF